MELSMLEMVAVAVIALLVLGPEEMIRQSHRLGKFLAKLRTQFNNFKVMVESEVDAESLHRPPERKVLLKDEDNHDDPSRK